MTVHHVDVQDMSAGVFNLPYVFSERCEVG
jgi:hypothetical protein